MSGGLDAYELKQEDVMKLIASHSHIGASNVDFQMEQYVFARKSDGVRIINLRKTWEKIVLAARAIAAIENPADVCVISARQYGQRAVLKFAAHIGATAIVGRFTPGTFTNQIQRAYREPRLLVVTDPRTDHQAITEASYVNIPIICLANTDSPLKYVDIAIPCNNKGSQSIGLMWWFLAREVLMIKGKINRTMGFVLDGKTIMPDLYFYRDPEDVEKEEGAGDTVPEDEGKWGQGITGAEFGAPATTDQWNEAGKDTGAVGAMGAPMDLQAPMITDWAAETQQWTSQQAPPTATTAPDVGQQWGGAGAADWS